MTKEQFLNISLSFELCVYEPNKIPLRLTKANYNTLIDNEKRLPILRPISDIKNEINHKCEKFIPITKILEQSCFNTSEMTYKEQCSYIKGFIDPIELIVLQDAILLIEWHFDIAGLIEKGEAVDINTLSDFDY